jgi:hypothetical protein
MPRSLSGELLMSIQSAVDGFMVAEAPSAIVIQGKWGIGKTHFWRHRILGDAAGKPWTQRYSYVSLFGVNSLAELKISLGVATEEFDSNAKAQWRLKGSIIRLWWRAQRWVGDAIQFIPKIGDRAIRLYERASFYAVRNRVICLDDVERRGSALSLRDVLGLVSYLVEDRNCRVVVILNIGQLSKDDQDVWNDNKEKVFHGELTYAPTLRETITLGLSQDINEPWYENAFANLERLGVSNIRIVHRTSRAIRLVVGSVKGVELEEETIEHISTALPLLIYSAFGTGDGAPPLDTVLRIGGQNPIVAAFESRKDVSAEEKKFQDVVREYGIYLHTPLDDELVSMLGAGFPDGEKLSESVRDYQEKAEMRRLQGAWSAAWRAYHDTLQDNRDEIIRNMCQAWPPVSHCETAHSLQSVVKLLRFLGEAGLASAYIQSLDERAIQSYSLVDDEEILREIAAARVEADRPLTLTEAFDFWVDEPHQLRRDVISVFAEASSAEIVALLMGIRSEKLVLGIRKIIGLHASHSNAEWQRAVDNFKAALEEIASGSDLAARRVSSWVGDELRSMH